MTGIEAPRVTAHADDAGFFLNADEAFGIRQRVRDGNLDLHMLAGAHAQLSLRRVHPSGRRQDHGFQARLLQALGEIARKMRDMEFLGHLFRRDLIPAR